MERFIYLFLIFWLRGPKNRAPWADPSVGTVIPTVFEEPVSYPRKGHWSRAFRLWGGHFHSLSYFLRATMAFPLLGKSAFPFHTL